MSETALTIKVVMEKETSIEFEGVPVTFEGLDDKFDAKAANIESTSVDVVVKGVKTLLNKVKKEDIKAVVDLKGIEATGTYDVPVNVVGNDNKLIYTSRTTKVKIVIVEKKK